MPKLKRREENRAQRELDLYSSKCTLIKMKVSKKLTKFKPKECKGGGGAKATKSGKRIIKTRKKKSKRKITESNQRNNKQREKNHRLVLGKDQQY